MLHPVFKSFNRWSGESDGRFHVDFLGVKTDPKYWPDIKPSESGEIEGDYPKTGPQLYEWVTVLTAALEARDKFVMAEIGAGYGAWIVRAGVAVRQRQDIPIHLIAVEGHSLHYQWMVEHFENNDLAPESHRLIYGVVTPVAGEFEFLETTQENVAYDSHLMEAAAAELASEPVPESTESCTSESAAGADSTSEKASAPESTESCTPESSEDADPTSEESCALEPTEASGTEPSDYGRLSKIRGYTLAEVLDGFDRIDLVHMDIQGAEREVIKASIDVLSEKVCVLCVGTHSEVIDTELCALLSDHGWIPRWVYPRHSTWATFWGIIAFADGCHVWINPRNSNSCGVSPETVTPRNPQAGHGSVPSATVEESGSACTVDNGTVTGEGALD